MTIKLLATLGIIAPIFSQSLEAKSKKPNVLFILCDDLRPQLNCYEKTDMITPNIDKLAAQGVLFSNTFCQVPVCGASRASLLSGIRPNESRFQNAASYLKEDAPEAISMPQTFQLGGYKTYSLGKVFHNTDDHDQYWDYQLKFDHFDYQDSFAIKEKERVSKMKNRDILVGLVSEAPDVADSVYCDGKSARMAARIIKESKGSDQPFFMALGFVRPHLPFIAPKKYWDMYDNAKIKLADNPFAPKNCPKIAIGNFAELRRMYLNMPKTGPVSDSLARHLVHGYYASTTYLDAQLGIVMESLKSSGQLNNTIIVLIGDHGWFLGEHGLWCKHSNLYLALNAPMIIAAPGFKKNKTSNAITEFIDIYPTLCDLTNIESPKQLQGKSLRAILKKPTKTTEYNAFSRYINGETIITKEYSYTAFFAPNSEDVTARMLYNLKTDKEENFNISELPENQTIVNKLHSLVLENKRNNKSKGGAKKVQKHNPRASD